MQCLLLIFALKMSPKPCFLEVIRESSAPHAVFMNVFFSKKEYVC